MTFSAVHRPAAISTGAVIGVSFGSTTAVLHLLGERPHYPTEPTICQFSRSSLQCHNRTFTADEVGF
jgi:hypothetical protein